MSPIKNITTCQAAVTVGVALLLMIVFAVIGLLPLLDLIDFGEETATKDNIDGNKTTFTFGIVSYLIILALDVVVALSLFIVLKPADRKNAFNAMSLRLAYVAFNLIAVLSLALLYTSVYDYMTLFAYFFFICHLFILGYTVRKSGYIPSWIGIFLIIASFSYLITEYGEFILPNSMYDLLFAIALIPASLAELTLGLYLLIKNSKMPETL